ncbi:MazG family protein [Jatrophihabitans sp. GAS493]|uniref:MazG family protein n=1 Tax=Jatrophihabitans sp. GAS493 TaxID=1907575 RepID=UPI001A7E13E5|nr:MazG family protein [Jatrophihabitans sp. GAS493]
MDEVIAVVDRLRSPGGCPWDRAQTHQSLAKYLLEESYETVEAIEDGDYVLLREELGDLLLQVLLHARLAEEAQPDQRFSIDEVADDLAAKMIRRHPHVFADAVANDADEVNANWERLKSVEKQRESVTDGVPLAQPALSLAGKLISRVGRSELVLDFTATSGSPADEIGQRLFDIVAEAVAAGVDPESALRETTRGYRRAILAAEGGGATDE